MTPDLRQLRAFIAVAEELHFGRAAERLALTQPPLSQQIKGLEEALGVRLFDRTRRSVALSGVGRDLLPAVRRLLADLEALRPQALRLARGEEGALSLAFVSSADYGILPPLLRAFAERYPRVRVDLLEATSDMQIEELLAGRIDAGLMIPPIAPRFASQTVYEPLQREPLVVALAATAELAALGAPHDSASASAQRDVSSPLHAAALADLPLIIFPRRFAPAFYDIIMRCFERAGVVPRIGQEARQMQTIVSLVSAGMGVALVPRSLRNLRRTGVVYRELVDAPEIEVGLVRRAGEAPPVLRALFEVALAFRERAARGE